MNDRKLNIAAAVFSIVLGILFGAYLLFFTNYKDALPGLILILTGAFTDGAAGIAQLMYTATPLIMCGLSVGFAFKTGLFNIGASGQFTAGAFAAVYIGVNWTFLPSGLHAVIAILGAALAGAFWGWIGGMLKAFCRVHEVISGIMLNYIGMYLINFLVKITVYDSNMNQSLAVAMGARLHMRFLTKLFPGRVFDMGFLLAVLFVILTTIVLNRTVFGFELKICGKNRSAGLYAGIRDRGCVVLSMTLAGVLSGMGGAFMFLSGYAPHLTLQETVLQQGFTGMSAALLGMSNPFAVLAAAVFIAYITVGGNYLQLYSFTPEIVDMIIAVIVYCGAFVVPIQYFLRKFVSKNKESGSPSAKDPGGKESGSLTGAASGGSQHPETEDCELKEEVQQ